MASLALACTLTLCACGGSTSSAPGAASAQALPKVVAAPAVPDDPLRLLPSQPSAVFSADVAGLRASPLFARAKRFAIQRGCVDDEHARWLLERTQRVVVARYATAPNADPTAPKASERGVGVFRGQYTAGDAREALTQTLGLTGTGTEPIVEEARGRFTVLHAAGLAAVQLDARMLAIGTDAEVNAMLSVADGKTASWLGDAAFMPNIESSAWLGTHALALLLHVDAETERRLHRSLSNLGAGDVTEGLAGSSAALALTLDGGARADTRVAYADAATAARAGGQLRSLIDQASMLLRFAGISLGLERTQVTTDDAQLAVSLELTAQQLDQLAGQLEAVLADRAPTCAAHPGDET
jgi:hypothetical protein